jgi:hypothetical protein
LAYETFQLLLFIVSKGLDKITQSNMKVTSYWLLLALRANYFIINDNLINIKIMVLITSDLGSGIATLGSGTGGTGSGLDI